MRVDDANDLPAIAAALQTFKTTTGRPTLIAVRSVIAWGSPHKANTAGAHGSPLGEDEVQATKAVYGWDPQAKFLVPPEVREDFAKHLGQRGAAERACYMSKWSHYQSQYPDQAGEIDCLLRGQLPIGWDSDLPVFTTAETSATRVSSGKILNALAARIPWLLGGSADLAPSTKTLLTWDGVEPFSAVSPGGRNFHFGIREHAMAAAANGMALSGLRPYVATFFVFTDYLRPAMRLSSMMHQPVLYILTHDSIGLGEDGPTHQPVEHLAACRAIPGLIVMRPGDANEVVECYRTALAIHEHPVALVLTRQDVATLSRDTYADARGAARGGYILADAADGLPEVILIGTGSELAIGVEAYERLVAEGKKPRLVSLPSFELFEQQDAAYREKVLPSAVTARVAVEAGIAQGWGPYLGGTGAFIGMHSFGASGPYEQLYEHFGITVERVVAAAKAQMGDVSR